MPEQGDILFSNIGAGIGNAAYVHSDIEFSIKNVALFKPDPTKVDNRYLFYCVINDKFQKGVKNKRSGSAQPFIGLDTLREHKVEYHTNIPTQRKIAAILSAYDDLIENNTRRIALLEQTAQLLYREWFVHFRFPGHESVPLVESELGAIPEGWEVVKLGDITTKIGSGATPRGGKNSYKETGISLIRSLNVYDFRFEDSGLAFIDGEQANRLSNVIVERRDILLNITGASVARCCMVPSYILPARVNQHVAIVRVNSGRSNPLYVLHTINSHRYKELLLAMAQGGATREALTKSTITNFEIIHPPKKDIDEFGAVAENVFEQQETLQRTNANLRATRDLLLPRLISGQLDVSELEIAVPQV